MERTRELGRRFWLFCCRYIFFGLRWRRQEISPGEALAIQAVGILGNPTVGELASFAGISQPNATYRVRNLVKKGYLNKSVSHRDKRECRLSLGEKAGQFRGENHPKFEHLVERLSERFSKEEMQTAGKVLEAAWDIIEEEEHERRF